MSYGAIEAIAKGLNIALTLGLATLVDIDNYGLIAIFIAIELLLVEIIVLGQHTVVLRFYESYKRSISKLYTASILLILISILFVSFLYWLLPWRESGILSDNIKNFDLLFLIMASAMHCQFVLYLAYLRAGDNVKEYGALRISYQVVKIFLVALTAFFWGSASSYPVAVLATNILALLALAPRINNCTGGFLYLGGRVGELLEPLKQNVLIGLPLALNAIVGVLYTVTDRFFLERLLSEASVAVYNFAFVQGTSIFFVINVLALAYVPKIYRSQCYNHESKKYLNQFLIYSILASAVFSLVVYFLVYPLSLLFVSSDYSAGWTVLTLALAAVIVHPLSQFGLYKLTLLKKVIWIPPITVLALLLNLLFNSLFIPKYGISGAAGAVLISEILYGSLLVLVASLVSTKNRKYQPCC